MPKVTVVVDAKSLEAKQNRMVRLMKRMRNDDVNFDRRLKRVMDLGINFHINEN